MGAVLLLLALAAPPAAAGSQDPTLPEYVVKAGFLFNFAKYVDWPSEAFDNADAPFIIGVVGADPFGGGLEKTLKSKVVKNRAFVIRRYPDAGEIRRCHILFVPRTEMEQLREILKRAEAWPVLTVGEDEGFSRAGGTANILIEKEKPRLEVNPDAAEKARLSIDPKLLKVAAIVRTGK
jgi:hypothetical protein